MENVQTKLKKKKGFTLIELIIVVAILGILALIAIPKFGSAQKDAKIKADVATGKTIANQAAKMIGEGTITLPSDKNDISDVVGKEMQGKIIPKSQIADESFKVQVDKEGEIKVYTTKGTVYPTQDGDYKPKE